MFAFKTLYFLRKFTLILLLGVPQLESSVSAAFFPRDTDATARQFLEQWQEVFDIGEANYFTRILAERTKYDFSVKTPDDLLQRNAASIIAAYPFLGQPLADENQRIIAQFLYWKRYCKGNSGRQVIDYIQTALKHKRLRIGWFSSKPLSLSLARNAIQILSLGFGANDSSLVLLSEVLLQKGNETLRREIIQGLSQWQTHSIPKILRNLRLARSLEQSQPLQSLLDLRIEAEETAVQRAKSKCEGLFL